MNVKTVFCGIAIFWILALSSLHALGSATHNAAGVRDPLKHGQSIMADFMDNQAECGLETSDNSSDVTVTCSEVEPHEEDVPCPDPDSPNGWDMCYGVPFITTCTLDYHKRGRLYYVVANDGPACDSQRTDLN